MIHIAIAADMNIEAGLHVTLYSAIKSLSESAVVHLFLKDFSFEAIERLGGTVSEFSHNCELRMYDATQIDTGQGKGLHQNKMPYVLLSIPELVSCERIICLDADLLITTDLKELFDLELGGCTVGAVGTVPLKYSWGKERDFLLSVGIDDESIYFNSGVLLIDTREWKKRRITQVSLDLASKHSKQLHTADQTVLNAVLKDQILYLPTKYNVFCFPETPPIDIEEMDGIYHFVGSPKPWDLMGEFLHASYPAFRKYLAKTRLADYRSYKGLRLNRLKRSFRIAGPYVRIIRVRVSSFLKSRGLRN